MARIIIAADHKSARGIGRLLGVSKYRASQVLNGHRAPTQTELKALALHLDCSPELLTQGVDSEQGLAALFLAWAIAKGQSSKSNGYGSRNKIFSPQLLKATI